MYLISIYFDEAAEKRISSYMRQIGKTTGNTVMLDGNVPPHITISAFQATSDSIAREIFLQGVKSVKDGSVQWVSVGLFLSGVIYLAAILNQYLQELTETFYRETTKIQGVIVNHKYMPYSWLPHSTLAKQLSEEQMATAVEIMQRRFGPFCGKVTRIGLSKTNPYTNLEIIDLDKKSDIR